MLIKVQSFYNDGYYKKILKMLIKNNINSFEINLRQNLKLEKSMLVNIIILNLAMQV